MTMMTTTTTRDAVANILQYTHRNKAGKIFFAESICALCIKMLFYFYELHMLFSLGELIGLRQLTKLRPSLSVCVCVCICLSFDIILLSLTNLKFWFLTQLHAFNRRHRRTSYVIDFISFIECIHWLIYLTIVVFINSIFLFIYLFIYIFV